MWMVTIKFQLKKVFRIMLDELLLLSGNDIPFIEAQLTVHTPSVKEIGFLGEELFFNGCGILNFSKDNLSEEDKINLKDKNDFELLMMIMDNNNPEVQKSKINAIMVLTLIFPEYQIVFQQQDILLTKRLENGNVEERYINAKNFNRFKEIVVAMFCLNGRGDGKSDYNPGGKHAKEIADKFAKRKQVIAEQQGNQKIAVLSRYSSILSVGLKLDLNTVLDYTVYQLFDQFERFELEEVNDMYFRAQIAGASGMKEPDNWKKDIHS